MALLLADENFPMPAVDWLRRKGHDVLTLLQTEMAGQAIPDPDVLAFATSVNRCLLTLNRKDFIKLHRQSDMHAGIVICTVDVDFAALAERVDLVLETYEGTFTNQLIRVQRPQV